MKRLAQPSTKKLGLWLVGASGNVATTVAVGLAALRDESIPRIGLTTESPPLNWLPLAPIRSFVVGGHEISARKPGESAEELSIHSGIFDQALLKRVRPQLEKYSKNIRMGTAAQCGPVISRLAARSDAGSRSSGRATINRLRRDLREFAKRIRARRVVVVHVASTEPPFKLNAVHGEWQRLDRALSRGTSAPLPASSLYAIAAIEEGMPFIGFTPSLGVVVPAICELAEARGVPIMGSDGKTGETLVRTVLAPMFRARNLQVESWIGHNVLGNRDGQVLESLPNRTSKIGAKNGVLASLVGGRPQTRTSIEYVESLHDWKTAWDHVHFRGFLGAKMSLQFTWQGCDSILAAPLIIDLARLADYHAEHHRGGVMRHLACYFKSPLGVTEHGFAAQITMLYRYVDEAVSARKALR